MCNDEGNDLSKIIEDEIKRTKIRSLILPESKQSYLSLILKHPLTSVIVAFILTGLVGTMIS